MDLNEDRLRTAYNEVVTKIDAKRNGRLSGLLFTRMQALVFDTAYAALLDTAAPPTRLPRMHVLSALPGTGKSTFSNAFAAAIVACGGSVLFVVEQMETADQRYRDLNEILPGLVAVWSTDHDKGNHNPKKVKNPAAQFHKTDLKRHPVAICTHEGYKKDIASLFRNWRHEGRDSRRTFVIIDEMVKEVTQYTIDIEAVARAVRLANQEETPLPEALAALDKLHSFLVARTQKRTPIDTLNDQAVRELVTAIAWFTTKEAERYAESREGLTAVFGFAKCLSKGWAFICTDGGVTMLTGYDNNLPIEHGTLQLDGTAKICGFEQLELDDRVVLPGPMVSFGSMRTVIEKPPTRQHLAKYLTSADNLLTYRNWMIEVIKRHANPGQRVLVVCKKVLAGPDGLKYFPAWEHSDNRWREVNYTTAFGYDLDGINVSVQWWGGPSTGHNAWQNAHAVFLFDANWTPRHKVLADMQGLRRQAANRIDMTSLRRQSETFKDYRLRCMMRDHVQAACRGRLRRWDTLAVFAKDDGSAPDTADQLTLPPELIIPQCGEQLLVCGIHDDAWLWENWKEMFPDAPLPAVDISKRAAAPAKGSYKKDWAGKLRDLLAQPNLPDRVSTRWIGEQLGRKWSLIRKEALAALPALADRWAYFPGKGSAPAVFIRT
jgi:hypothetical protein